MGTTHVQWRWWAWPQWRLFRQSPLRLHAAISAPRRLRLIWLLLPLSLLLPPVVNAVIVVTAVGRRTDPAQLVKLMLPRIFPRGGGGLSSRIALIVQL